MVARRCATRDLKVDALIVPGIGGDDLVDNLAPAHVLVWIRDLQSRKARFEARQMFCQTKWPARIDRQVFVGAVTELKATVLHRDARYADWHHFTVEKDVHGNGFVLRLLMLLLGCFCAY